MEKRLIFPGRTEQGIFNHVIAGNTKYLEKTASEFHPTIAAYINSARAIPGKTQVLLTALGAGEFWGANSNGDYFPEKALAYEGKEYGYKTFITHAKVYKHHMNKDPHPSYGVVVLSVYNPIYHRVELIIILDNEKAPDIVAKIEAGEVINWSMGCRIPYDECSICGNKAPTREQYCEHAKYMLGQIDPTTGKQVFVINWHPRFHDISYVLIPADKIAVSLLKVASFGGNVMQGIVSSAFLAEKFAANVLAVKTAEIQKQIPATEAPASTEALEDLVEFLPEMKAQEPKLPTHVLDQLAQYPLATSMSSMASLGILPKPQEFQRIFLIKMNQKPLADELDRNNVCFHPDMIHEPEARHENAMRLHYSNFEPNILSLLKSFLPERSCAAPHMANRVLIMVKQANKRQEDLPIFVKTAEEIKALPFISKSQDSERKAIGVLPMLLAAAGLYSVFGKSAPDVAVSGVGSLIQKHPGLAAALGVGIASTFGALIEPRKTGNFSRSAYVNPDKSDAHGYINSMKQAPILKISSELGSRSNAVAKRLFIGIPAAYLASGVLQKHKDINRDYSEGSIKGMIRKNPDILSGALIADSMFSLKGKGSYGLTKTITPKLKNLLNSISKSSLTKQASIETLSEVGKGMIFPIAMGGASMPSRIAGGLIDTAVINAASYLSKRKKDRESFK